MSHRPHIVVLDGYTMNPGDLSWEPLQQLGRLTVYDRSAPEEVVSRSREANILLVNKVQLTRTVLEQLPRLSYIAVTATGYNNIDVDACAGLGIPVSNAVGYGSTSVAQHVFALLLTLTNRVQRHSESVKAGDWAAQSDFCYWLSPIVELNSLTLGIYGFGSIGQQVARIAQAYGMSVLATHRHPERDAMPGVQFVELSTLFAQSDVISLNVPLSADNTGIVDARLLGIMKPTAYLINTARGGLINEEDLATALRQKTIAGAALDVLATEPAAADHPFYKLDNCVLTPHQAWASVASRQRLLDKTVEHVTSFLAGEVKGNLW